AMALLNTCGCFCVVLPALQKDPFIQTAATVGLHLRRETVVYTKPNKPPKRVLMEFVKKEETIQRDSLVIHEADGDGFTIEYKEFTRGFYL
ncbi:MAG: tRNA (adenosine(37)-N6)-methyltransferase TrmM, partial [Bacteroidales bacterium]|nr:tRNA (adenosine(37)-N6)-methyltransferase TrmM [Bacteroidales bacterium]